MGGGAPPPTLWRGLHPLRPWTRSFPPYVHSFSLYTWPSRIGGGGFSSPCVHSLYRTFHTELHKITYETRAYFFTHSGDRRALVRKVILYALVAQYTIVQLSLDITFHAIECGVKTCPGYGDSCYRWPSLIKCSLTTIVLRLKEIRYYSIVDRDSLKTSAYHSLPKY